MYGKRNVASSNQVARRHYFIKTLKSLFLFFFFYFAVLTSHNALWYFKLYAWEESTISTLVILVRYIYKSSARSSILNWSINFRLHSLSMIRSVVFTGQRERNRPSHKVGRTFHQPLEMYLGSFLEFIIITSGRVSKCERKFWWKKNIKRRKGKITMKVMRSFMSFKCTSKGHHSHWCLR